MARHVYVYLFVYFSIIAFVEPKKFKVKLLSANKCDAPADRLDPTEPVTYEVTTKNLNRHTKLIGTNFTVLRPTGPITMSLRIAHLKQNGNKKEMFKLEKVDCHNPITYQLLRVANLKINNDCIVLPGNFVTENVNVQDFAWILTKTMIHPGKYEYLLEYYTEKGIAACDSIICDIKEHK